MLGGSEIVVKTSFASYDLLVHASWCAVAIRLRANAPSEPSHLSMTLHATSQSDSELRLSQEHVKYGLLGGSKVVFGTSTASYD